MPEPLPHSVFQFGSFDVDTANAELRKNGVRVHIQDQPLQVLTTLVTRPNEVVTREELRTILWPQGTFVDYERGLNAAIARLRQVLNDSAERPRYVETVSRRGYRFIAPVKVVTGSSSVRPLHSGNGAVPRFVSTEQAIITQRPGSRRLAALVLVTTLLLLLVVSIYFLWGSSRSVSVLHVARYMQLTRGSPPARSSQSRSPALSEA